MKKHLLFIFIGSIAFAQNYIPMAKENNSWKLQLQTWPIGTECQNLPQEKIDYILSTKLLKIIDGKEYREIYRQYNFDSKESFQKAWLCDKTSEAGNYLGYLNENNYNQAILVGYLRDDVENKKVYIRQFDGEEKEFYDFSEQVSVNPDPYVKNLYEINNATYFNISTREFVYKIPAQSVESRIYEGIGDIKSDFIYQTSNNIDGFFSHLLGFSNDDGLNYYSKNNELLKITNVNVSKKYMITENPTRSFVNLNTTKDIKEISIIDINGRIVLQQNNNFDKINVSKLTIGKYYLVITTHQQKEVISFLKK